MFLSLENGEILLQQHQDRLPPSACGHSAACIVPSPKLADVAQKLEQLEMAMYNGQEHGISHLAYDIVRYNPSDLSTWLESMLSEFNTPSEPTISKQQQPHQFYCLDCNDLRAIPGEIVYGREELDLGEPREKKRMRSGTVVVAAAKSARPVVLKFAHFIANQAILEAFEGKSRVHVIDFSMKQGMQWPTLIQALALRPGGPPIFWLTGICPPQPNNTDTLQHVRKKLAQLADTIHVEFRYRGIVANSLADVEAFMLDAHLGGDDEVVAVNLVFELHRLFAHPGAIDRVLAIVKAV